MAIYCIYKQLDKKINNKQNSILLISKYILHIFFIIDIGIDWPKVSGIGIYWYQSSGIGIGWKFGIGTTLQITYIKTCLNCL